MIDEVDLTDENWEAKLLGKLPICYTRGYIEAKMDDCMLDLWTERLDRIKDFLDWEHLWD